MSSPTILIVEDEEIVSADIADQLRKPGCEVAGSTGAGKETSRSPAGSEAMMRATSA